MRSTMKMLLLIGLSLAVLVALLFDYRIEAPEQNLAALGLQPLLPLPATSFAVPFLAEVERGNAEVAKALHGLDHGDVKQRAQAAALLKHKLSGLEAHGQIVVRLELARSLAGLTTAGHRSQGSNAAYRGQLSSAVARAAALSEEDQAATLVYALAVWRAAEGREIDWARPPFKLAASSMVAKAIVERAALGDWRAKKEDLALRKYRALAQSLTGTLARADVDLRVLDMTRIADNSSKGAPRAYEAALLRVNKDYLDTGILGSGNEARAKAVASEVVQRFQTLVDHELAHAATPQAQPADRKHALGLGRTLLGMLSEPQAITGIKSKMAHVYVVAKQYAQAVTLYKELADASPKGSDHPFVLAAIRVQSLLAVWPETPPWAGAPKGHNDDREELLSLYRRADADGGMSWVNAAHEGLLSLALERRDEAFTLWQSLLKRQASGPHAANAAGFMLTTMQGEAAWGELEALARLCSNHKLVPVYKGKALNASDLLATALLEEGKQALAEQNYPLAVRKLAEVVAKHGSYPHHDEAMVTLASAFRGAGRHADAIKTLVAFEARYPRSSYYRQGVLNGGDWAAPMAYEDNTAFFYQRFLSRFPKDGEAPRVREALTQLHLGLGHYADALSVLHQMVTYAENAGARADALQRIMAVEQRSGSLARAGIAAQEILQNDASSPAAKAEALGLKASLAASQGRFPEVATIERQLAAMGAPEAQESLGEARYFLAEGRGKTLLKKEYNLTLRDPSATLKSHYAVFRSVRQSYQAVCDAGATSYCALAMLKLSQLSLEFGEATQDIAVQDDLAPEVVKAFQQQRQSIMNDVATTSQQADTKALAAVRAGLSDPDATQAVLWQTAGDWNFERVSGENGNGFVQWPAD